MKSHIYDFRLADIGRLLSGLLLPMIGFAAIMRLGAAAGILPSPRPCLDMDQTILSHQAEASRSSSDADVLFIGDSSCLMDFLGKYLEEISRGNHRVINLGSLSYLGLNGYAALLSRYVAVNAGRLQTVVVLLHPEMLRGVDPVSQNLLFLSDYYARSDYGDTQTIQGQLRGLFGLDVFQDRLLSRAPLPLPKQYGQYYGFNLDLYRFMDEHGGSAIDPHQYVRHPGQGNAEYRLAPKWEAECQTLRAAVPPTAKLVIGVTPVPHSFAPPDYAARWKRILTQWGQWMQADTVLAELPPILPDSYFASTTHLNANGARRYTEMLATCLERR